MGETSGTTIRSGGIGLLNQLLTDKKSPIKFVDTGNATLANQGAYLPLLIGRRRIAPVFAYEGLGVTVPLPNGDLNIFDIGRNIVTGNWDNLEDTHWQPGWHPICIGPARRLHMIYRDGRPIIRTPVGLESLLQPIESSTVPSGSTIPLLMSIDLFGILSDLFDAIFDVPVGFLFDIMADVVGDVGQDVEGIFSIYWGEYDQPTNAGLILNSLFDGVPEGISTLSRWPWCCYVHWGARFLGTQEQWPTLEYEVEVRPRNTVATLSNSSAWFDAQPILGGIDDSGANPAHALLQMLCEPYPHGMGIPVGEVDLDSLEALGVLCENEHLPVNILASDGESGAKAIADVLQNVGVTMSQLNGKQYFIPIRVPDPDQDEFMQFVDSSTLEPRPDTDVPHGPKPVNRMIFEFDDGSPGQNFRSKTVAFDDDSDSIARPVRSQTFNMSNIVDLRTAYKVGERRAQEELVSGTIFKFKLGRRARALLPGAPIFVEGFGVLRVLSVSPQTSTSAVTVEAIADHYGVDPGPFTPSDEEANIELEPRVVVPEPDLGFRILEKPYWLQRESPVDDNFLMFRTPTVTALKRGQMHVKYGGDKYRLVGRTMRAALGGVLEDDWYSNRYLPDVGPVVVADGPEWTDALDLSGDDESWRNGRFWFVIQDEICFIQSVTALGDRRWRINGVIRARFDTFKGGYGAGTRVYLQDERLVRSFKVNNNVVVAGVVVRAKSQPMNVRGETVPLAEITELPISAQDKARSPIAPRNLRCNHTAYSRDTYGTGDDLVFDWDYQLRDGESNTPIDLPAGVPILVSNPTPSVVGLFDVEISDGITTINEGTSSLTLTLSNASLVLNFGGEPASLTARVKHFITTGNTSRGSQYGPAITISKV